MALGMFALTGASCPTVVDQYKIATGPTLPAAPTLAEVIDMVDANSARVQSLYSTDAAISGPGMPTLNASLALSRPRRFRLRAETALSGPEVDLGSNDELFWFWVRRNEPPALYYCRHDRFAQSNARQLLPVQPEWLIEALGVPRFDASDRHTGPEVLPDGRLRVVSTITKPEGPFRRELVVDATRGFVLEQHLHDASGNRIASAVASEHQRDPLTNAVLPRTIDAEWPQAAFSMRIRLHELQVNYIDADQERLWTLPEWSGMQTVDIGHPNFRPPVPRSSMRDAPPAARSAQPVIVHKQPLGWLSRVIRR